MENHQSAFELDVARLLRQTSLETSFRLKSISEMKTTTFAIEMVQFRLLIDFLF